MQEISITASRDYKVLIGPGLLERTGELSRPLIRGSRAMLVAGERVFDLYGDRVSRSLSRDGFSVERFLYPGGEDCKTPDTLLQIITALSERNYTRADAIFALGGGVTTDLAGLAAALYQRGIACVLLPTTLLAAADASVGGKTAVNLPGGKNQMGAFSQPALVLCDTDSFQTLDPADWRSGWGEVIKCAFLRRAPLHQLLEIEQPDSRIEEIAAACVSLKRDLVQEDERDMGNRRLLNFGHTVGHAIETLSGYRWPHGCAVAAGMAVMTRGSTALGLCGEDCLPRLERLLRRFELPERCEFSPAELAEAALKDKKRADDRISLVLPKHYGECTLLDTDLAFLRRILELGV